MFSFKILSILALIALLCFIGVITLQVMELNYYVAAPSVWPFS